MELSFDGFLIIIVMTILTSIKGTVNAVFPHVIKFEVDDKKKKKKKT